MMQKMPSPLKKAKAHVDSKGLTTLSHKVVDKPCTKFTTAAKEVGDNLTHRSLTVDDVGKPLNPS